MSFDAVAFPLVLLWLAQAAGRPKSFLWRLGFCLPFMTPHVLSFFFYTLVGPLAVLRAMAYGYPKERFSWIGPSINLLTWAVVITIPLMLTEYLFGTRIETSRVLLNLSAQQSTFKMPVQLIGFLMFATAGMAAPLVARKASDAGAAIQGYLSGLMGSFAVGLVLYAVTGHGFLGRSADVEFSFGSLPRMGGLSGEPKMFGCFLLFGVLFSLLMNFGKRVTMVQRVQLVLLSIAMLLTLSTSSWIGLVVALGVLAVLSPTVRSRVTHQYGPATLIGVAVFALMLSQSGRDLIQNRILDRLFGEGATELEGFKDMYLFLSLAEKPWMGLAGFGLGGADLEATEHVIGNLRFIKQLQYTRTPTPSLTLIRLWGDLGLVGIGLYVAVIADCARWANKSPATRAYAPLLWGLVLGSLLTSWMSMATCLFLSGAVMAAARLQIAQDKAKAIEKQRAIEARTSETAS